MAELTSILLWTIGFLWAFWGMYVLVKDVSVRKFIDLDRPDLLQGLQLVQGKGFAIDPQAIISAEIQPNERP